MTNLAIVYKTKERLNKLDSQDYTNIETSKIVEAFNKALPDWCRRQLHGTNLSKTGDEQTKRRIDDLQVLLRPLELDLKKEDCHFASTNWPEDYFEYKRVSIKGATDCCQVNKGWKIYLVEEENIDILLTDVNKKPNFEWRTTLVTLMNNTVKIWTNDEFDITEAKLTYYKQPRRIQIQGVSDPYTGQISQAEVECEFKDDIVELLIDETVKILSGDIEYGLAHQIADKSVESNN